MHELTRHQQRAVRACDRLAATYPDPTNDWEAESIDQHIVETVGKRFNINPETLIYLWTCVASEIEMQHLWDAHEARHALNRV